MKKLFLALTVLGSVIASSLTAFGYEDRRDHDWNDGIGITIITATGTVSEAIGVITITSLNSSESARIGAAFEPRWRTKASFLTRNIQPKFGAIRQAAKALGQFIQA